MWPGASVEIRPSRWQQSGRPGFLPEMCVSFDLGFHEVLVGSSGVTLIGHDRRHLLALAHNLESAAAIIREKIGELDAVPV